MPSTIVETFKTLKKQNGSSVWLWSMLLTRGLTWDNVWDVYPGGVATEIRTSTFGRLDRVPGPDMLATLPDGPTNILEVFNRLRHVQEHYPVLPSNYEVLEVDRVIKAVLTSMKGVECTWPQVKTILESTQLLAKEGEDGDVSQFLPLLEKRPALLSKALTHMAKIQHRLVGTQSYAELVRQCPNAGLRDIWDQIRSQIWEIPEDTIDFLSAFAFTKDSNKIPVHETLDFLVQHPSIVDDIKHSLIAHGFDLPKADAYFEKACAILAPHPDALLNLHVKMKRGISLEGLRQVQAGAGNNNDTLEINALLKAYQIMPLDERDTPAAQLYFADVFQHVDVRMEHNANGYSNALMATIISENPTGAVARILALHACAAGLFSKDVQSDDIKAFRVIFKHDPTSKTGHAAIIRKYIPDFKDWFAMVQDLGLNKEDIWQLGLQALMQPAAKIDTTIDASLFDATLHNG